MARLPTFAGQTSPGTYALAAPALLLLQPLAVMLIHRISGWHLVPDLSFWVLPLRRLAFVPMLSAAQAALAFAICLTATWGLALLSFRRARWSGAGYVLAVATIVPGIQIVAAALLALLPRFADETEVDPEKGMEMAHVIQGVLAGVAIIVLAVLVSALTFGAYGWGLFVMTPFMVGLTVGYLANRRHMLSGGRTAAIVLAAAALGSVALIMGALEGLICILLASPLGAVVALIGGAAGRAIARAVQSRGRPLLSLALLPALFAIEAAVPPSVPIETRDAIDIAAPPAGVWKALTSSEPIGGGAGVVGAVGFAFPVRGRLAGAGVGAIRFGDFSTGTAIERVTEWEPGRCLAFQVERQPPAMEEMSPYPTSVRHT